MQSEREFKKNIFNHSNKELVERLKSLRPISETESVKIEMTRRLIISIDNFNKSSSNQTRKMIKLTYWIIGFTVLLGFIAIIQIVPLLKPFFLNLL